MVRFMGRWKLVGTAVGWLTQMISGPAVVVWIFVSVITLAIAVLLRADVSGPICVQMVIPVAWALLVATVVVGTWRVWVALSPKCKLRRMAEDVDTLANLLSNKENYGRDVQGGLGPPLPHLEIKIAALKGKLESIGVHSPPSTEGERWQDYLPLLRGWVANGDLHKARSYKPGTTAIVGWRE